MGYKLPKPEWPYHDSCTWRIKVPEDRYNKATVYLKFTSIGKDIDIMIYAANKGSLEKKDSITKDDAAPKEGEEFKLDSE